MSIGERLKQKSRDIADKFSQQYRQHVGEDLADRAQALQDREASLDQREKNIKEREAKLSKYYLVPRIYVQLPLIVALGVGAFFFYKLLHSQVTETGSAASAVAPSQEGGSSVEEAAVYGVYGDIDAKDPNFDVGGYCLKKEKEGTVTFEQCMAIAAAKIAGK